MKNISKFIVREANAVDKFFFFYFCKKKNGNCENFQTMDGIYVKRISTFLFLTKKRKGLRRVNRNMIYTISGFLDIDLH